VSREASKQFIETIEEHLKQGRAPKGVTPKGGPGALATACKELGFSTSGGASRLAVAERTYRKVDWSLYRPVDQQAEQITPVFDLPEFPTDDISAEDMLDHLQRRFEKKLAHEDAKTWFKVKIKTNDPVGLAVVGDPHLGTHCNIPLSSKAPRVCLRST